MRRSETSPAPAAISSMFSWASSISITRALTSGWHRSANDESSALGFVLSAIACVIADIALIAATARLRSSPLRAPRSPGCVMHSSRSIHPTPLMSSERSYAQTQHQHDESCAQAQRRQGLDRYKLLLPVRLR